MNFIMQFRWQTAAMISLLINLAVFGLSAHIGRMPAAPAPVEYVPVALLEVGPETAAVEPLKKEVAPPPRVIEKKPEPVVEKRAAEAPPVAAVEKEKVASETAPPPIEKEAPPQAPAAQAAPPPDPAPAVQAPQASPAAQQGYRAVGQLTRKPSFRAKVEPVYPESLRSTGFEGKVVVEVFLNARGAVDDARIIKSGGPVFNAAVLRAVKASVFEPGYVDGEPVPVRVQIPFAFQLR